MEKTKADVVQLPVEKAPKGNPKGKGEEVKKYHKVHNKYSQVLGKRYRLRRFTSDWVLQS